MPQTKKKPVTANGFDPIVILRSPIEAAELIVVRGGPGASG